MPRLQTLSGVSRAIVLMESLIAVIPSSLGKEQSSILAIICPRAAPAGRGFPYDASTESLRSSVLEIETGRITFTVPFNSANPTSKLRRIEKLPAEDANAKAE